LVHIGLNNRFGSNATIGLHHSNDSIFTRCYKTTQLIRDEKADKCKKYRLWNQETTGNVVHMSASLVVKLDLLILTTEGKRATRGRDTNKNPDRRSNYTYPGSLTFRTL
jgi:hypothetical protein